MSYISKPKPAPIVGITSFKFKSRSLYILFSNYALTFITLMACFMNKMLYCEYLLIYLNCL
ncbi:MAG: hypothetical protein ACKPKO_29040 [Candidatus Fonsibacter sp.]